MEKHHSLIRRCSWRGARRRWRAALGLVGIVAATTLANHAVAEGLDLSFGDGGRILLNANDLGADFAAVSSIAQQNDGKIIVVGTRVSGDASLLLLRLTADGALDANFGSGGTATGTGPDEHGEIVRIRPGGEIVVAGSGQNNLSIWQFSADGLADSSFGGGTGVVRLRMDEAQQVDDLLIQPDGSIIAAALSVGADRETEVLLLKFDENGNLATDFGDDGLLRFHWQADTTIDRAIAVLRQADGKLLLASGDGSAAVVARMYGDGTLDAGFADGGIATFPMDGTESWVSSTRLALQDDGKILVSGHHGGSFYWLYWGKGFLLRLNPDGLLDPTFGNMGFASASAADADIFTSLTMTPSGAIVVGRALMFDSNDEGWWGRPGMLRFEPGGTLAAGADDPNLWTANFGFADRPPLNGLSRDLLRDRDGGFLLATDTRYWRGDAGSTAIAIARFSDKPDHNQGVIGFDVNHSSIREDDGVVELRVLRSGGNSAPVEVRYTSEDATATAGSDYVAATGVLQWAEGDSSPRSIAVKILADATREPTEYLHVRLMSATGGAQLATSDASVTIFDVSAPPAPPPVDVPPLPGAIAARDSGGGATGLACLLLLCGLLLLGRWDPQDSDC